MLTGCLEDVSSLVRDIHPKEGTIIIPVFTAKKTKAQKC